MHDKEGLLTGMTAAFKFLWGTDAHTKREVHVCGKGKVKVGPTEFDHAHEQIVRMGRKADELRGETSFGDKPDSVAEALAKIVRDIK